MLKFLLLNLFMCVHSYNQAYLLECWDLYSDRDKLSLCVSYRHYESLWKECQFGDVNN